MTGAVYVAPRRDSRLPAIIAAVLLHLGVLAFVILVPVRSAMLPVGSSVPINIVSSAPFTDTRQAVQAPVTESAATPQPTPQAPPQPPAATPAPPAFSPTASQSTKAPTAAAAQAVGHAKAPPTPPAFDANRLQQIINQHQRSGGAPESGAQRGPTRQETAQQDRPNAGQGLSISDQAGLQQLLGRLWILPCNRPEVAAVGTFKVTFTVTLTGQLLQQPKASGVGSGPVSDVVVRGALDAVKAATPLPAQYYGQTITVNFNSKQAYESKCAD